MVNREVKIGVIGGNGVAATNRLCDIVERNLTDNGAFRDAHHPEMIVWQATSTPSRSMFLEGRGPDWRPDYIRIAKALKQLGCTVGCMCCNTAHYAIEQIVSESGLRFLNLLQEVSLKVASNGCECVEVLCSDGARKFNLYGEAFARFCPSVKLVYPDEARQRLVTRVICDVKNRARFLSPANADSPISLLRKLIADSKYPVVLGCTDLRVALAPDENVPDGVVVDSLECLADAIIREAENGN